MIEKILESIIKDQVNKVVINSAKSAKDYLLKLGFKSVAGSDSKNISFDIKDIKHFQNNYGIEGQLDEVACNCYYNGIAVGGKLFLTLNGIEFHPHNVMQKFKFKKINFEEIKTANSSKQFFLINNCMTVIKKTGTHHRFVLGKNRKKWIELLNRLSTIN